MKITFTPNAKTNLNLKIKTILAAIVITSSFCSVAEIISSKQVIKDITYLASDDLKGRASFSPEIDQAANYIAQRFKDIGLKPLKNKSFLQPFTVHKIQPQTQNVVLNHKKISREDIAIATTIENIDWQNSNAQVHIVGKDDDMRKTLSELNQQGGQHLVVIHNTHAKIFKAYQNYFTRGLTKLSLEHPGALVLVLSDEDKVENYAINASVTITQQSLTNVVGILPGRQSAKEIVLYSSHYDHLGITEDGKQIYNGADDDASGTTAVLNLAQYYAEKGNNKRTLMFSAFTAEEIGGFGSKYFSQQLNPDNVVAMINIEMIGKPSKFGAGTLWMTGMERSNLGTLLNDKLVVLNRKIYQDPYPEQGLFYRSDNATLARLGVPAHSFSSTQLDKDQHYHKVTDDISSLDLSSMHQVIETLATATQALVDGSATPTRIDKTQVRVKGKIY
ncbi:M20/M25/M40 family metallo-hydrolase [Cognaticolwellia beringensis]|uniref:Peptidase M23 n=1 Tax=Cognaticolwellia beringensis TaxID=1967665 RepID=A0A222GDY2_9GAMM|nr:M20/M25/M40 family metallo-hydrolase [Cognaticolwellia beringensis]ASP50060.1 peptidase M23 [Cognaticolwellia beringensis]